MMVDMFEQIGDVIPRFQLYEQMFSASPRLLQSLSNAYLDIIKFCTSAKNAFQKARKSGSFPLIRYTIVRVADSVGSRECKIALQDKLATGRAAV